MRKLCTRQHFIEYLGYNYVEKQCLLARCTWERYLHDFGFDGFIKSYNEQGEIERGRIDLQIKSTEVLKQLKSSKEVVIDLSIRDLESYLENDKMTLVVIYDVTEDKAYFVEIGDYFKDGKHAWRKINKFVRIRIPASNLFSPEVVKFFREIKNR